MRVAVVTHNIVRGDGQGRVNLEFVRFLLEQGHSVELFADRVDEGLIEAGAAWTPIHPGFDNVDLLKVWHFKHLANRHLSTRTKEFDAVVACGVVLGIAHDMNVAHFVHGTWLRSPFHASKVRRNAYGAYQWLFSWVNSRWERQVFRQARLVGAVSKMVADELKSVGVPQDKIKILNNGVDVDEFRPGPANRTELGLPEGVVLALFVGDIRSPIKNLDTVLQAMKGVDDLHLAVAGRTAGSPYPSLASQLGVADRVHFLGFRTDIAALMRAADFFVLVSRRDSCPLVVLEAIASGLPVATARTVGNHDLVADCGFVIDTPDSHEQLESALTELTANNMLREDYSAKARTLALANTWQKMSERYLDVLSAGRAVALPAGVDA